MAARAVLDRRLSLVTHQIQACVSRTICIPRVARPEWAAFLPQDASRESGAGFPRAGVRNDRRDGAAALRHRHSLPGLSDFVEDFETAILELSSGYASHRAIMAIAIWPCRS